MKTRPKLVMIGGGSNSWDPQFVGDSALAPELSSRGVTLPKRKPDARSLVFASGEQIRAAVNGDQRVVKTRSQDEALSGDDHLVLPAQVNDPQIAAINPAAEMRTEMRAANRLYLPQYFTQ